MNVLRAGALFLLAATTSCGITIVRALALDPLSRYVVGMRSGVSWSTCSWRSARLVGMSRRWDGADNEEATDNGGTCGSCRHYRHRGGADWLRLQLLSSARASTPPRCSLLVARCSVATRNRLPTLHTACGALHTAPGSSTHLACLH
jgi:hypothetical protein